MNKVKIIGIGPGTKEYLLPLSLRHIKESDCLVGAKRILSLFKNLRKEEFIMDSNLEKIIPFLKRHMDKKKIAILVSGDCGLYSFLDIVCEKLKKDEYEVIPGISTLQLAFARIGESWHDAAIISLHGRVYKDLAEKVKHNPKIFILTDPDFTPRKIASYLLKKGVENRRAVVLENLSYPDERIIDVDLKSLSTMDGFKLCVMIISR